MSEPRFVPLSGYRELPPEEMRARAAELLALLRRRRSVRQFSDRPVPRAVIEDCIRTVSVEISDELNVEIDNIHKHCANPNKSAGVISPGFVHDVRKGV